MAARQPRVVYDSVQATMHLYAHHMFPRMMDWIMGGEPFQRERARLLAQAHGVVLEIGIGTGLNLPHYPPAVTILEAVDPAPLLPKRLEERRACTAFPVRIDHVSAERLPYEDASFDYAVSTWTLCTIADPVRALREVKRVLSPEGVLLFLEHGRSDDRRVARWQDLLNPIQRVIGCGCNLNRKIDHLIMQAGLTMKEFDRFLLPGVPRIGGEMYRGVAGPC